MKPVRLKPLVHQSACLGAALHGMSIDDFFNIVVAKWIVAANGVLLMQPPCESAGLKKALTTKKEGAKGSSHP